MMLMKPVGPIPQSSQKKNDMETFPLTERKVATREENSGPEAIFREASLELSSGGQGGRRSD